MSNTLLPMELDTAMSPIPAHRAEMELYSSRNRGDKEKEGPERLRRMRRQEGVCVCVWGGW